MGYEWTEERIKENQAKDERMLDAAFGPVAEEAAAAPPLRVQALPEPEPDYPDYEDVYAALTSDRDALAVFQDGWEDTFTPYNLGPPPADMAGQLRWYILRDLNEYHHKRHRLDFEDAKKHRTRERVERLFRKLSELDPLYGETLEVMDFYAQGLPPSAQKALERLFHRCPHEALEFYKEMRAVSGKVVRKRHARRKASGGR